FGATLLGADAGEGAGRLARREATRHGRGHRTGEREPEPTEGAHQNVHPRAMPCAEEPATGASGTSCAWGLPSLLGVLRTASTMNSAALASAVAPAPIAKP